MSILSHPLTLKGRLRIRDALGFLRLGGEIPSWTPSEPVSEEILCSSAKLPLPSLGQYFAVTSEAKGQFSPDPAEIFGISFFSIGKGVCKVSGQWHIRFLWKSLFTSLHTSQFDQADECMINDSDPPPVDFLQLPMTYNHFSSSPLFVKLLPFPTSQSPSIDRKSVV